MSTCNSPIRLAVFDLDGTLLDAFEDITKAANHVRTHCGLEALSLSEVKLHVGHGARQLVEGVLPPESTPELIEDCYRRLISYYYELTDSTAHLYDGVEETLRQIKGAGIITAVASNKPHEISLQVVAGMGLSELIDDVIGEQDNIPRKPAPDPLLYLMKRHGVAPESTIMVGDTEIDIQCAKAAGVRVACVTYGQYNALHLEAYEPDFIADTFSDIGEFILSQVADQEAPHPLKV